MGDESKRVPPAGTGGALSVMFPSGSDRGEEKPRPERGVGVDRFEGGRRETLAGVEAGRSGIRVRRAPASVRRVSFTIVGDVDWGKVHVSGYIENGAFKVDTAFVEFQTTGLTRTTFFRSQTRQRFLTAHPERNGWILLEGQVPSDTDLDPRRLTPTEPGRRVQTVYFGLERKGTEVRLIEETDPRIKAAYERDRAGEGTQSTRRVDPGDAARYAEMARTAERDLRALLARRGYERSPKREAPAPAAPTPPALTKAPEAFPPSPPMAEERAELVAEPAAVVAETPLAPVPPPPAETAPLPAEEVAPVPPVEPPSPLPPPPEPEVAIFTTREWLTEALSVEIEASRVGDRWDWKRTKVVIRYFGQEIPIAAEFGRKETVASQRIKFSLSFGRCRKTFSIGLKEAIGGLAVADPSKKNLQTGVVEMEGEEDERVNREVIRLTTETRAQQDRLEQKIRSLRELTIETADLITALEKASWDLDGLLSHVIGASNDYLDVLEARGDIFAEYRGRLPQIEDELRRIADYRTASEAARRDTQERLGREFDLLVELDVAESDERFTAWSGSWDAFLADCREEDARLEEILLLERRLKEEPKVLLANLQMSLDYGGAKEGALSAFAANLGQAIASVGSRIAEAERIEAQRIQRAVEERQAAARTEARRQRAAERAAAREQRPPFSTALSFVMVEDGIYRHPTGILRFLERTYKVDPHFYRVHELEIDLRSRVTGRATGKKNYLVQVMKDSDSNFTYLITPPGRDPRHFFVLWSLEDGRSRINQITQEQLPPKIRDRLYLRVFHFVERDPLIRDLPPLGPSAEKPPWKLYASADSGEKVAFDPKVREKSFEPQAGYLITAEGERRGLSFVKRPGEFPEYYFHEAESGRWFVEKYSDKGQILIEYPEAAIAGIVNWLADHGGLSERLLERKELRDEEGGVTSVYVDESGNAAVTIRVNRVTAELDWTKHFSGYGIAEGNDLPFEVPWLELAGHDGVIPSRHFAGPKKDFVYHLPMEPVVDFAYIQFLGPDRDGPYLLKIPRSDVPSEYFGAFPKRVFYQQKSTIEGERRVVTLHSKMGGGTIVLTGRPLKPIPETLRDFEFTAFLHPADGGEPVPLKPFVVTRDLYSPLFLAHPDGKHCYMLAILDGNDSLSEFERGTHLIEDEVMEAWNHALAPPAPATAPDVPATPLVVVRRRTGQPEVTLTPSAPQVPGGGRSDGDGGSGPTALASGVIIAGNLALKIEPEWRPPLTTVLPAHEGRSPVVIPATSEEWGRGSSLGPREHRVLTFLGRCEVMAADWGLPATRALVQKIRIEMTRGRNLSGLLISSKEVLQRLEKMPDKAALASRLKALGARLRPEEALLLYWAVRLGKKDELAKISARLGVEPAGQPGITAGSVQGLSPLLPQTVRSPVFILK